MISAGLTGGLASGKSFAAAALAELGCIIINADQLGHQLLEPHGEAYEPVVKAFGRGILDNQLRIDRGRLAAIVFADETRLAELNSIVHPLVFKHEDRLMGEARQLDPSSIVIVEAAILIETGSYRRFDRLILVVCTEEQQIERAMARGLTREQAVLRLKRQMPLDEKRKYADFLIDTSGSKEVTIEQTRHVYRQLRSLSA